MIWPFRKRRAVHVGPTSVDWAAGDMAECIASKPWRNADGTEPKRGDRLMVADVLYGGDGPFACFCLRFVGRTDCAFDSRAFRKIVLTDTGADRTVARDKPVRVGVDA